MYGKEQRGSLRGRAGEGTRRGGAGQGRAEQGRGGKRDGTGKGIEGESERERDRSAGGEQQSYRFSTYSAFHLFFN